MKNIVDIIPGKYDMISGSAVGALLQGKGVMKNVNILILGEQHDRNIPCFEPCTDEYKCVETIDIPEVLKKHLPRKTIDLYVELGYHGKNKFSEDFGHYKQTRMNDFGEKYSKNNDKDKKGKKKDRIRVHYVDIRNIPVKDEIFLYKISFGDDILASIHSYNIDAINDNDKKLLKESLLEIKRILNEDFKTIVGILSSSESIEYKTKIKRQRKRALLTNKKTKDIINSIDNYFEQINKILLPNTKRHITWMRKVLKNISSDQTLIEIQNTIIRDRNKYTYIPEYYTSFLNMFANYMDRYTIYRMLRVFDKKEQTTIMFYGGAYHSTNIYNCFMNTGMFNVVFNESINEYENYMYTIREEPILQEEDCIRIKKL